MSIQRAPIRRGFDVRAKVTPPKPVVLEKKPRRPEIRPIEYGLAYLYDWGDVTPDVDLAEPEDQDQAMARVPMLSRHAEGPLFEGAIPVQIVIAKPSGLLSSGSSGLVWVVTADFPDVKVWLSTDKGVTFELKETEVGVNGRLDVDASGRPWWSVTDDSGDIETRLYRSDDIGETWTLIETFADYGARGTASRGVACHPTDENTVAIGALVEQPSDTCKAYFTTDGSTFSEITLPAQEGVVDGALVFFTRDGSLIIGMQYIDASVFESHLIMMRAESPYTSFATTDITPDSVEIRASGPEFTQARNGDIYAVTTMLDQSATSHRSEDFYPFGQDGQVSEDGYSYGVSDSTITRESPGIYAFKSVDDGETWEEIETPFHVPDDAWPDFETELPWNEYVPGEVAGIQHHKGRLFVFFRAEAPLSEQTDRMKIDIVIGTGAGADFAEPFTFTVGDRTYEVSDGPSWSPGTPVTHPPTGLTGTLIGNVPERGYTEWWSIFSSTAPVSELTTFSANNDTFFLQNDNAQGDPNVYNGRAVGFANTWGSPVRVDAVRPLSQSFIAQSLLIGRNEYAGDVGTHEQGYLWTYDGSEWTDKQENIEDGISVLQAVAQWGAVSI
jgi:hypothetical protein